MPKERETNIFERQYIVSLSEKGFSQRKISSDTGIPRSTVQDILKKYKNERLLVNKVRSGRPKILSEREERQILNKIKVNPSLSGREICAEMQKNTEKKFSVETVRRVIRKSGRRGRVARKKPWINKVNRQKRLEFAKKYINASQEFWETVIFSDECKFDIFDGSRRQRVWRKPGEEFHKKNLQPTVKHGGGSIMVWGCMSAGGVGKLQFIEGIMNQYVYIDILKNNLKASAENLGLSGRFVFQQDNDPKHCARTAKEWVLYNVPKQLHTPPQSPDINPIEHLWSELKTNLRNHCISSKSELKRVLQEEWDNVNQQLTKKLVKSMPNRLKAILESKGYPTKY